MVNTDSEIEKTKRMGGAKMTQRRNWHVAGMMALSLIAIGLSLAGCDSKPTEKQSAALSAVDHKADFEQKLAALRPKAEAGDPLAQFEMGKAYEEGMASSGKSPAGDGTQKDQFIDLGKASTWYEKAANQGNAEAQYRLGMLWLPSKTDGPSDAPKQRPQDAAKAAAWLEKAAKQKHAEAAYQLAQFVESGSVVDQKEFWAAFVNYLIAAEKGHAGAQYAVGLSYYQGAPQNPQGTCTDPRAGRPLNDPKSPMRPCLADKDPATAALWWEKAAEQGHATAMFKLAGLLYRGDGVQQNRQAALQWLMRSAEKGDSEAQWSLGQQYLKGQMLPRNDALAVKWFEKSAQQGDAMGQIKLAEHYFGAVGDPRDLVLAYAWYNVAAASGTAAAYLRDSVGETLNPTELAEAQRISSSWKPGRLLKRESTRPDGGAGPTGKLEKAGTGTLFIVNKNGQAITNHHVVSGCTELRVEGRDGVAKLMTEDKVNDLALVRIPGKVEGTATIVSKPEAVRQGEDIVVFGFPLNAVLSSGGNLTPGMVSALTGLGNNTNQLQITAPIQPGSSGSPVLNKKGEVVGVVAMKLSDSKMARATGEIGQNVNFAVSGQTLKAFLDKHKVEYRNGAGFFAWEKDAADLAEAARTWTTVVECWR